MAHPWPMPTRTMSSSDKDSQGCSGTFTTISGSLLSVAITCTFNASNASNANFSVAVFKKWTRWTRWPTRPTRPTRIFRSQFLYAYFSVAVLFIHVARVGHPARETQCTMVWYHHDVLLMIRFTNKSRPRTFCDPTTTKWSLARSNGSTKTMVLLLGQYVLKRSDQVGSDRLLPQ